MTFHFALLVIISIFQSIVLRYHIVFPEESVTENKTVIVQIDTRDMSDGSTYWNRTAEINRMYAKRFGYAYVHYKSHVCLTKVAFKPEYFCKPAIIDDLLQSYDSVMFLDSDAWFTNFDISLENFFKYAEENMYFSFGNTTLGKTFIGMRDCGPYIVSAAAMFWRKSNQSDEMLDQWKKLALQYSSHQDYFYEQNSLRGLLTYISEEFASNSLLISYGIDTWGLPFPDKKCAQMDPVRTYFLDHISRNWPDRETLYDHLRKFETEIMKWKIN